MTTVYDIVPTLNYDKATDAYTSTIRFNPVTREYTHSKETAISVPSKLFHQAVDVYQHVYGCEWSTALTMASSVSSWGITPSRVDNAPIIFYRVTSPDETNLYY